MADDDIKTVNNPLSMAELEAKFVPRELCGVKTDLLETTDKSIKEIVKELAEFKTLSKVSFTEIMGKLDVTGKWQTQHQKLHDGWWKRSGIVATIIATCISLVTLVITVIIVTAKLKH